MATTNKERTDSRFFAEFNNAMVSVGEKFGLYSAIAEVEPASETDIARYVGINRTNVAHWLSEQAAAGYLYVDAAGRYSVSCPINHN